MSKGSRTGHLTLVKRGGNTPAPVIEPVESLAPEALRIAERLKLSTGRPGAIVGVIHGRAEWDVRLVLLVRDELRLLRVTSPIGTLGKQAHRILSTLERAKGISGIAPYEFGEFEGRIWVERRYYNETLSQNSAAPDLLPTLVDTVRRLEDKAIIHGNISLSNIAVYAGKFVLLDLGFAAWSAPYDPTVAAASAPELALGVNSVATDVYGIGQVAVALLTGDETPSKDAFIRTMVLSDAGSRPTLNELEEFFGAKPVTRGQGKLLGSGKLLKVDAVPAVIPPKAEPLSAEDRSQTYAQAAEPVKTVPTAPRSTIIPVLAATLLILAYVAFSGGGSGQLADDDIVDAWNSNQPSMMREVAARALEGERSAQTVIISDTIRGAKRPLVKAELIKLGFFPQWEAELSDDDRQIILALALNELKPIKRLPSLGAAHPAVLLSIATEFPLDADSVLLSETSAVKLSQMPGVIGTVFKTYLGAAELPLADKPLRALARIALGRADELSIQTFMGSPDSWGARIVALAPLFTVQSKLPGQIIAAMQSDRTFQRVMLWFQGEPLARWSTASDVVKLSVIAGIIPDSKLIPSESLADLLAFPSQAVRNAAVRALKARLGEGVPEGVLGLLSADSANLSRASIISFVGALQLSGDEREALLARWFETRPGVEIVTALVLAWNTGRDAFPVIAARYLIENNQDNLSPEIAQKLVLHSETLVRAYAYSKLSPKISEELQLLMSMGQVEPNQRLRTQLAEKISEIQS